MLSVQLLGGFEITADGHSLAGQIKQKGRSLLAYLLVHHELPQERSFIAHTFWPDSSDGQALTNLRRELYQLRRTFPPLTDILEITSRIIQLKRPRVFDVDVLDLTRMIHEANQTDNPSKRQKLLQDSINLYRGELLPGFHDEWVLTRREELHQLFIHTLDELIRLLIADREYTAAILRVEQLLRHDPLRESSYLQLMELYALQNDRARAIQVYRTCMSMLEKELGVPPGHEIEAAYQRLLNIETRIENQQIVTTPSVRLVGRKPEWRTLISTWRETGQGHAKIVLIAGEAGIGKTRLAEELLEWASQQGISVVRGRSYAAEGSLAYAPIIDWLRSPPLRLAIAHLEPVWRSEVSRLLPELLAEFPKTPAPHPLTESWQRRRLFEAIARTCMLDGQPKIFLADDLQWCDHDTLAWLHFLLRFNPPAPVLIVGTVRSEEVDAGDYLHILATELQGNDQLTQIELGRLSQEETAILAQQELGSQQDGNGAGLDIARVYAESEGNPLFVVEMVRSGQLTAPPQEYQSPSEPLQLPPRVFAVIRHRLNLLSPPARSLAALAAAIGRSFSFLVLLAASESDEEDVVIALDELWRRHVIREVEPGRYDFTHDRIREAMYVTLNPTMQRLHHKRIAQAIVTVHADELEEFSGQLGFHYEQALHREESIKFYRQAADMSSARYAYKDALFYLQRIIKILEKLPATKERIMHSIDIWLEIARILVITDGWTVDVRKRALDKAYDLARQAGNQVLICKVLDDLFGYYANIGNWLTCTTIYNEMVVIAESLNHSQHLRRIYDCAANLHIHLGKFELSLLFFDRVKADANDVDSPQTKQSHWLRQYRTIRITEVLWFLGYPDRALNTAREIIYDVDETANPFVQVHCRAFIIYLHHRLGRPAQVRQLAEEILVLCDRFGLTNYALEAKIFNGWVALEIEAENGLHQTSQAIDLLERMGDRFNRPYHLGVLAESQQIMGFFDDALETLNLALKLVKESGDRSWEAELVRMMGDIRLILDPVDATGEEYFKKALETARHQGAKSLELRAATSLARLWQRHDKRHEAHTVLAAVYDWFTEGFDTPDLIAAKELLAQLSD